MASEVSELSQVCGLYSIGASVEIEASPERIFDLLASPSRHVEIDGSGSVRQLVEAPERLSLGARFRMGMFIAVPYKISNEVISFEEDREIAWRHWGHHVWRYRIEPLTERTTKVTESFEWENARGRFFYEVLKYPEKNGESIRATLANLARVMESSRPD
jgi:hypothetical protein